VYGHNRYFQLDPADTVDLIDIISPLQDCVLQEKKSLMICVVFSFDFYSWQVSGLPGKALKEMDDGRKSNVKKLVKLADEMLASPCMEHLPYGGRVEVLDRSNKDCLDWFAEQLIQEHQERGLNMYI
jgi:hypothetical protein